MSSKVIQVILYLTSVSHLVYCRPIQRDLTTFAKVSKRSLDCNSEEVLKDISEFNRIFIELSSNGGQDIKISNETIQFLEGKVIEHATHSIHKKFKFSAPCRQYTNVMALKYELQDFVFTMENNNLSNLIISVIATDITHVIIQLEYAAFKLQSMTLKHHKKSCVEFTAAQYHDIYTARFHNHTTFYDSLVSYAKHWGNLTDNCHKLKHNF